ncbi:hypothetical protein D3C87_1507720 [compost metagenome]
MLVAGADIILAGNILGGENANHPRCRPHGVEIHAEDFGMRLGREAEIGMHRADRLDHVVDIFGRSGDMLGAAVVAGRGMECGERNVALLVHHATSLARRSLRSCVHRKKRLSRF